MNGFVRSALALTASATMLGCATSGAHGPPSSLVSMDIYDRNGATTLPVYGKDGRRYVVGTPGHEYTLRVRNHSGERILAVTSVDGVNVVSGETAAPAQSGYVIEPWGSVEIAGWRKSLERTAAFYFTDLGDSYAARTGRPGNVGVIGVAVFKEKRPVISYRRRPDLLSDAPHAREELPASAAAAPAPSQPAEMARADGAAESRDRAMSKLGTGHGRNETSYAQQVRFERASDTPFETLAIQYDRRENLIAMGVLPSPRYAQRYPDPFPGRFAPDPR